MSYNFGAYENEHVNDLLHQLSTEFDTAKRAELAIELQQTILDDNAYVFCSFLEMRDLRVCERIGRQSYGHTAKPCPQRQPPQAGAREPMQSVSFSSSSSQPPQNRQGAYLNSCTR